MTTQVAERRAWEAAHVHIHGRDVLGTPRQHVFENGPCWRARCAYEVTHAFLPIAAERVLVRNMHGLRRPDGRLRPRTNRFQS